MDASGFLTDVLLALEEGRCIDARNIASLGAWLYPDDTELQKMARILATPSIIESASHIEYHPVWRDVTRMDSSYKEYVLERFDRGME